VLTEPENGVYNNPSMLVEFSAFPFHFRNIRVSILFSIAQTVSRFFSVPLGNSGI
jgi:hypothetical protein